MHNVHTFCYIKVFTVCHHNKYISDKIWDGSKDMKQKEADLKHQSVSILSTAFLWNGPIFENQQGGQEQYWYLLRV